MKSPLEIAKEVALAFKEVYPQFNEVYWTKYMTEIILAERQRQERLVKALKPFAKLAEWNGGDMPKRFRETISMNDLELAQQVLKEVK